MSAGSDVAQGKYSSEIMQSRKRSRFSKIPSSKMDSDGMGLEFEDLVPETKFQAWSPNKEGKRSSGLISRPRDAILVENRIETTSDMNEGIKQHQRPF